MDLSDKYTESLVNGDSDEYFETQLKQFKADPSFPLYEDFDLRCMIEEVPVEQLIKHSIKTDPKNPLFDMLEMVDEEKDRLINELIHLYKKLHLETDKGLIMSRKDKTRLRLIDQLARKNIKTRGLASKLFESFENKKRSRYTPFE